MKTDTSKSQKPYHTCPHDADTLRRLQALPLKQKVFESRQRITEWYEYWEGKVYVAFSGGKDSTVLLDLVRRDYPDVPAVFYDTGLEFPEIREFVKTVDNVVWLKPDITFREVLKRYGYPVISKSVSDKVCKLKRPATEKNARSRRLYLEGVNSKGQQAPRYKLPLKWRYLIDSPFPISEKCCEVMKKRPGVRYQKETGQQPMTGEMASDSRRREEVYYKYGCNTYVLKNPKGMPMIFWEEGDVWDYLQSRGLSYSRIYDMGYGRTGCVFCAFGAHMEKGENRFQRMRKTHPKLHKYCMENLGMREVLEYCGIPTEPDSGDTEVTK